MQRPADLVWRDAVEKELEILNCKFPEHIRYNIPNICYSCEKEPERKVCLRSSRVSGVLWTFSEVREYLPYKLAAYFDTNIEADSENSKKIALLFKSWLIDKDTFEDFRKLFLSFDLTLTNATNKRIFSPSEYIF